jgi:hypothetical protein
MARNRIIYASQSVWVDGEVLYRVQSLGTSSSFTSEDVFELGHLDIVDVVDDVPAVTVTLNTNDFGDVKTLATLAQVASAKKDMDATATVDNANLVAGGSTYLHGVALADFAVVCGNLNGVTLWAPVQDECSIGTLANNIDQTLFLDAVFVNSLEFSYTTGANATENYGAETDNKMWLLNDGRFVNFESTVSGSLLGTDETDEVTAQMVLDGYVDLSLATTAEVAMLSTGIGFLRKTDDGEAAVTYYNNTTGDVTNIAIVEKTSPLTLPDDLEEDKFVYTNTGTAHRIYFPSVGSPIVGDRLEVIYAANAYAGSMNTYFTPLEEPTTRPDGIGAVRQGQVEAYVIDPDTSTSYETTWRLTGVTLSADLTREPLTELGHLGPYDRPLTLPIPINITVESTAGDLETWARFAGKLDDYTADTLDDIDLTDLMIKDNLILVVKVYHQTDEEAGGTGANRRVLAGSELIGDDYFDDGVMGTYVEGDVERPLKTMVVKNLKITDESMTLDLGSNATQSYGFRTNNDLFAIKGGVSLANVTATLARNA